MNVLRSWEELVSDLQNRINSGDESCRPLLKRAELELNQAREKQPEQNREPYGT